MTRETDREEAEDGCCADGASGDLGVLGVLGGLCLIGLCLITGRCAGILIAGIAAGLSGIECLLALW